MQHAGRGLVIAGRRSVRRPTLGLALAVLLAAAPGAMAPSAEAQPRPRAAMAPVPAGRYVPLYGRPGDGPVRVAAFQLDRDPVTRADFLRFVRQDSAWRRDRVSALFADRAHYLSDWPGPLQVGSPVDARRPVTNVSWFAARAYCEGQGKRLPTIAEWEYAMLALDGRARDPEARAALLAQYATRHVPPPPVDSARRGPLGLRGAHDLVWEWVEDFSAIIVSPDSRGVASRQHDLSCASAAVGATDPDDYPAFLRYAVRAGASARSSVGSLGFRCAR
jgi:formylglycine-generating enzyme